MELKWRHSYAEETPRISGIYFIRTLAGDVFLAEYKEEERKYYTLETGEEYYTYDLEAWAYESEPEPMPPIEGKIIWHDLMESVPKVGEIVLVTTYHGYGTGVEIARYKEDGEFYTLADEWYIVENVSHWAYLPAPATK